MCPRRANVVGAPVFVTPNVNSNEHCRKEIAVMQKRSLCIFAVYTRISIYCEAYEHAQGTILHICIWRDIFSCESFTRKFLTATLLSTDVYVSIDQPFKATSNKREKIDITVCDLCG